VAGPRFRTDDPRMLDKVELDGLTAIYHQPSGTTHILAAPAPQILDVLGQGPATAPTILARMKRRFALETGKGSQLALESRLAELEAAGLVWRV
jgi:PqqD family protein of HPr-rel-A system